MEREIGPQIRFLSTTEQLLDRDPDIARNLAQEWWQNIPASVEGDRSSAPIGVSILAMRSTLTRLQETEPLKERDDFARLEDRDRARHYGT